MEYLFSSAAPMLHTEKVLEEAQWRGTVILLACYLVFGAAIGLLAGFSMNGARELPLKEFDRRNRKLLILLMAAAFGINLVLSPSQPGKPAALLAGVLITAAVVRDFGKAGSYRGISSSPAAVAICLILSARLALVNWKTLPLLLTVPITLVAAAGQVMFAVFAIRLALGVRTGRFWNPVLDHCMIAATVIAMVFGPGTASSIQAKVGKPPSQPAGKSSPNIILLTMDTVRADHLGIYGYARQNTPNLRRLLQESTLYTDLVAASSITLTSHATMFTGLYPRSHGAYKQFPGFPLGRPLADGIPTIASILDSAGYHRVALSANLWFLGQEWGMLRGFEYSWTPRPMPLIEANHAYLLRSRIGQFFPDPPVANDLYASAAVNAATINRRAITMLDQLSGQEAPFFLFLNYMDAHWPYHPPAPYDTMYPGRSDRFTENDDEDAALRNHVDCDGEPVPTGYAPHAVSQYDGSIGFMDLQIGELVGYLKQNGLFENTLIIITSDHGEALGDHGSLGHNASVYQDQIHVPLIVKYPGSGHGGRVEDRVSHVDILPTILDVAGLAPRSDLPGVSLRRLTSKPNRTILSERHYGPCQTTGDNIPEVQFAVLRGSSKLISSSNGVRELYDVANDPGEKNNLYPAGSPAVLEDFLQEWMRSTPRRRESQQPLDPEQMKRLRSLGYLQ